MASVETSEACMCVSVELSKELRNHQPMVPRKVAPASMGGCLWRERTRAPLAREARVFTSQLNMEIIRELFAPFLNHAF